jgi:hypothetical protein
MQEKYFFFCRGRSHCVIKLSGNKIVSACSQTQQYINIDNIFRLISFRKAVINGHIAVLHYALVFCIIIINFIIIILYFIFYLR